MVLPEKHLEGNDGNSKVHRASLLYLACLIFDHLEVLTFQVGQKDRGM